MSERKDRDTYRCELKDGRKIVYIFISTDPNNDLKEHEQTKDYTHLNIVGPRVSHDTAEKWLRERLRTYMRGHLNKKPKYNEIKRD